MQWVSSHLCEALGRGDVVHESADGDHVASILECLPAAQQLHDEVAAIALVEQLRDEVQVGDEGRLKNDGHVGRVEQLDGVGALLAACFLVPHRQVDAETLQQGKCQDVRTML